MAYSFKNQFGKENNKIGKIGKGKKITRVQTIIIEGNLNNLCKPLVTRTIIHRD